MTTVSSVNSTTSTSSSDSSSSSSLSNLGIDDFITLMVAQLKNQDPTNPQDTSQYVTTLAQISTVSGIQEMNDSLDSLLDEMRSSQATNATNLVGHDVLIEADSAAVTSGNSVSGAVDTPSGTSSLTITVSDSSGRTVSQFEVSPNSGDLSSFTWDGTDSDGNAVDSGTYTFTATAVVNGTTESAETLLNGKVSSVTIDSSDNSVTLNTDSLGSVGLSDVRQVS